MATSKYGFVQPNEEVIGKALGDITQVCLSSFFILISNLKRKSSPQLSKPMQLALTNRISERYEPVKILDLSDWLYAHVEEGQTMSSFVKSALGTLSSSK
jgi:hypothetical protein